MSTLVIGGSGKTGAPLVRGLRARGVETFAASRSGERRFDWADEATWDPALAGVDRLYSISPLGDTRPQDRMIPLFERALAHGVKRVVLLSSSIVTEDVPGLGEVARWVREHVPEWTVLRPSWFMQNFFDPGGFQTKAIAAERKIVSATGTGRLPFVDAEDIAAVAVRALVDDTPHQAAHLVTGPEALSYDEVAKILGVRHDAMTPEGLAAFLVGHGMPPSYAQLLAMADMLIASGAQAEVSDTVERVTGRPPRAFADLVRSVRGS